ncbi:MAG: FAD-dependent oxidoreductase [Idiomarina sp.]|nr:FAD-dependent oxidoreductase [Idiomarina sp.]
MDRPRHPKKEVEKALRYAEQKGWRVTYRGKGHCWGQILCEQNSSQCRCGEFCITSVNSTPRNEKTHANQLKRVIDNCIYKGDDNNE